jgi:predicted O-linked N-acetylglucosamine transferase (SPINDLY family)
MRVRMSASPLMDAPRLTKNLEAAYDNMWSVYLSAQKP